jgi:hypothetical protein
MYLKGTRNDEFGDSLTHFDWCQRRSEPAFIIQLWLIFHPDGPVFTVSRAITLIPG